MFTGFFNQVKQEFVSARWLYFEGVNSEDPHISDRDVLLYNTLDYPTFGLAVEKVKIAFRMAYSLFDKIAYFLNHYLKLGIREWQASFKAIWYERPGVVRKELEASENWPLRGLYWLSKDLFEKGFSDLTDPDARALDHLRNHLEHKYVKVHSMGVPFRCNGRNTGDLFFDHFAHSVSNADLEQRTLRLMKLVRSALIYLSLGMHREEQRRRKAAGSAVLIAPMRVDPWDDEWKRRW
nr:LA2681 family HEPN domain-containing protein [uncultured Rhodopila sp.]